MKIKKILLTALATIIVTACLSGCGQTSTEALSDTAKSGKSIGLTTNSSLRKFEQEKREEKETTTADKAETGKYETTTTVSDTTRTTGNGSASDKNTGNVNNNETKQQTTAYVEQPTTAKEETTTQKTEEETTTTTKQEEETTTTTKQEEVVEEETECSHCWRTIRTKTPVYRTITHEAVTHEEYTTVQKPLYMTVGYINCKACGWSTRVSDSINGATMEGYEAFDIHICECHDGYAQSYLSYKDEIYDYEEVVETVTVVDEEAWTETYIESYTEEFSHYQCFKCGAVRYN